MRARAHLSSRTPPQPRDGEKPMRLYSAPYAPVWHILAEETEMRAYALCGAECYGPRRIAEGITTCEACAAAETHRRRVAREREANKPRRPTLAHRLAAARAEGRREGRAEMREMCMDVAIRGGGHGAIYAAIRALPVEEVSRG